MKKNKVLIAILACILVVGISVSVFSGRKPFKDLVASDIVSAAVHLVPPDKTIQITELKELVAYLNEVVIYNEDNSYTEYDGQGVIFTLTMSDGTKKEIMAYHPFLVIDGTGYKTKYEPCDKLNNYANRVLNEGNNSSFGDPNGGSAVRL